MTWRNPAPKGEAAAQMTDEEEGDVVLLDAPGDAQVDATFDDGDDAHSAYEAPEEPVLETMEEREKYYKEVRRERVRDVGALPLPVGPCSL
jgi:hypothetical protein